MSSISTDKTQILTIEEPSVWFAPLDEELFYSGLNSISAIKKFTITAGKPLQNEANKVHLHLEEEYMDDQSLRNLLGLMHRYSLDLSSLSSQCNLHNKSWFSAPGMYWHESVFGKNQ